jgi:hypothetical protein
VFTFITDCKLGEEVNPLLSGYFTKLVGALLNYKKKELLNHIFTKPGLLESLLQHIYDKSISDLVVKILNISETAVNTVIKEDEDPSPEEENQGREERRQEGVCIIIDKLISGKTIDESLNASQVLCELSKYSGVFEYVSNPDTMDKIAIGLEHDNHYTVRSTL